MDKDIEIRIESITRNDRDWMEIFYQERWGASRVVTKGVLHEVPNLPGFVAWKSGKRVGLLCYQINARDFEIVTLDSLVENIGVGSGLITKAVETARIGGCKRVWLITTNDNTPALHFYQKRGFHIIAIHVDALKNSRKLKPEIPQSGLDGIPLRDEIELEIILSH